MAKNPKQLKIIGLAGSLREKSFNGMLLDAAAGYGGRACIIEIASIQGIPLYNQDVEDAGIPKTVKGLQDRIAEADGLLLVTPEYNHSIPGVFKNAIDWLTRPPEVIDRVFAKLPVALIGTSPGPGGSGMAQLAWLPVLQTLKTQPYFGPMLIIPKAGDLFSKTGKLTDPKTKNQLQGFIHGFCQFVKEHHRD
jgi:chromate reductase